MKFVYGMRLRPFSIGCQPSGVAEVSEDDSGKYWNILYYKRKLTDEEVHDYELDYIGVEDER